MDLKIIMAKCFFQIHEAGIHSVKSTITQNSQSVSWYCSTTVWYIKNALFTHRLAASKIW